MAEPDPGAVRLGEDEGRGNLDSLERDERDQQAKGQHRQPQSALGPRRQKRANRIPAGQPLARRALDDAEVRHPGGTPADVGEQYEQHPGNAQQ